jgi:hypothetical protein
VERHRDRPDGSLQGRASGQKVKQKISKLNYNFKQLQIKSNYLRFRIH